MAKFPKIIYVCPLSIWKRKNIDITMLILKMKINLVHIPLGLFSESGLEMRNKDRRKARPRFSRKTNRIDNI